MSEFIREPAFIYACIGVVVGFLSVIIMTISEGKPSDSSDAVFTVVLAGALWPLALLVCIAWILSKVGIALGLSIKNKWGHLL